MAGYDDVGNDSLEKGLQTVSLIRAMKDYSAYPLAHAKAEVERFIDGATLKK